MSVGQFKMGRIAQTRQPHLTNQVIGDPQVHRQGWAERERMVAFAGYPLVVDDRVVGVMAIFARHPLAGDTLQALASVADSVPSVSDASRPRQSAIERAPNWSVLLIYSIGFVFVPFVSVITSGNPPPPSFVSVTVAGPGCHPPSRRWPRGPFPAGRLTSLSPNSIPPSRL
ncbi:MAG: GAF domain-containing protein [Chloroflexota bacterium]